MEHNRATNIKYRSRTHNIYGDNLWRGPRSRADVAKSTRMPIMHYDPQASWLIQEKVRPMHWDPRENWNADASVADVFHRRNPLEQVVHASEFVSSPALAAAVASAASNQSRGGKSRKHKKGNRKHKKSSRRRKH